MLSSKSLKNGLLRILNDIDSARRGKKRDEEGGTRGRWDEESEKMKKLLHYVHSQMQQSMKV